MEADDVDGLMNAIDNVHLRSRPATPTTGEENAKQCTIIPNQSDAESGSGSGSDSTKEFVCARNQKGGQW
ncbi:hypothetical protein CERZMDRAFT_96960 [Cercospora zeae-maydis SCOH1-5]|uniref:Uncharacterized protein n=1 Tax=Cercospora zeae-maydis SCOH1-5 TaxID=717836 RepID=A0A6A6FIV7_9PEZI|nr:hypothetical protein CERZMDRAFT_96960 [Cercospora zeae-maydis SCOH1-5]